MPCDGTIILGHSELLERSLAGHVSPTFRGVGEGVVWVRESLVDNQS